VDTDKIKQTLYKHSKLVDLVSFSQDSTLVASASWEEIILIWSVETGECTQALHGHSHGPNVRSLVFSHDSTLVASGSDDKMVRLWSVDTGECIRTLTGHSGAVISVAFSHDSTLVASGSNDGTIRIWSVDTGECLQMHKNGSLVDSVAFSYDSMLVAAGSRGKMIWLLSADTGECIQTLTGHSEAVLSVAFSHDSTLVVSASEDKTVRIWRTDTGECIQAIDTGLPARILSFEPDSHHLLTTVGGFTILDKASICTRTETPEPCAGSLARRTGYGISIDKCWVTFNGENILWLPVEFRPASSTISGSTIAIGCHSGIVIMLELSYCGH
jgi:WD40 repeat protein